MAKRKFTFAVEQRLRFIDFLLAQYGRVNRSALMDYFGISMPQASIDLQQYLEHAGHGQMRYDASAKAYVRNEEFKRCWP
ncbi:hypothetical protein [Stenotrophomonas sp. TD3]|uniref:hypothetical protein n=1 Tax=Stenotrophomonas sp. TD3 TaxID=1641707 RepID=UPI000950D661|nr:hypothetical protein [Stenotrophomonas sp. TD3]